MKKLKGCLGKHMKQKEVKTCPVCGIKYIGKGKQCKPCTSLKKEEQARKYAKST